MTADSSQAREGFVSPAEIFQSFETGAVAAEELEARATGMADQAGHEQVAVKPSLTTVRQDAIGLGTAAAEAILRMLEHPDESPPTTVLPAQLIVRESSGPAA